MQTTGTEELSDLIGYFEQKGAICPTLDHWDKLYRSLKRMETSGEDELPTILILNGWSFSSNDEKKQRFIEHLHWAERHGVLDQVKAYLMNLTDEAWYRPDR